MSSVSLLPSSRQELLRPLTNDDLATCYQPLVHLADGRLLGLEALARWHHPGLGLLPATALLSMAGCRRSWANRRNRFSLLDIHRSDRVGLCRGFRGRYPSRMSDFVQRGREPAQDEGTIGQTVLHLGRRALAKRAVSAPLAPADAVQEAERLLRAGSWVTIDYVLAGATAARRVTGDAEIGRRSGVELFRRTADRGTTDSWHPFHAVPESGAGM
jgi:hypothetical protein